MEDLTPKPEDLKPKPEDLKPKPEQPISIDDANVDLSEMFKFEDEIYNDDDVNLWQN
jgi:hypothetical protein